MEELLFVEAYGDYVKLFTKSKVYIKEERMKNLESSLPPYFIRVHRSYIVNSKMVVRTELYGKESHLLYLLNGQKIKASPTGFKLLKGHLLIN